MISTTRTSVDRFKRFARLKVLPVDVLRVATTEHTSWELQTWRQVLQRQGMIQTRSNSGVLGNRVVLAFDRTTDVLALPYGSMHRKGKEVRELIVGQHVGVGPTSVLKKQQAACKGVLPGDRAAAASPTASSARLTASDIQHPPRYPASRRKLQTLRHSAAVICSARGKDFWHG